MSRELRRIGRIAVLWLAVATGCVLTTTVGVFLVQEADKTFYYDAEARISGFLEILESLTGIGLALVGGLTFLCVTIWALVETIDA